jgi:hypothetical protein
MFLLMEIICLFLSVLLLKKYSFLPICQGCGIISQSESALCWADFFS